MKRHGEKDGVRGLSSTEFNFFMDAIFKQTPSLLLNVMGAKISNENIFTNLKIIMMLKVIIILTHSSINVYGKLQDAI